MKSLTPRQIERMARVHQAKLESTPETWAKKSPLSPYVREFRSGKLSLEEFIACEAMRGLVAAVSQALSVRTMASASDHTGSYFKSWYIQGGLYDPEIRFDLRQTYRSWWRNCVQLHINPVVIIDFVCHDTPLSVLASEQGVAKSVIRQIVKRGLGVWRNGVDGENAGRRASNGYKRKPRLRAWRACGERSSGKPSAMLSVGGKETGPLPVDGWGEEARSYAAGSGG